MVHHMISPASLGLRHAAIAGAVVLLAGLHSACWAQSAVLRAVSGKVELVRDGNTIPAVQGLRLRQGDVLQSAPAEDGKPGGEALVRFKDGARSALRENSAFEIKALKLSGPAAAREKTLSILKGSLRYISGLATTRQKVSFVTSTATIGIRGTDIEILVSEEVVQDNNPGTYLKVNTGIAIITATDGAQVEVAPGEVAYGGEPELVSRGVGGVRRAAARKVQAMASGVFKAASLDRLMR
jgi:OmpA-OmpF porin, OOP family